MVRGIVQFENRLVGLESMAAEQSGLLELRENAIDRRQSKIEALGCQGAIDFLGGQVALPGALEQSKDPQAWRRRLEADGLQVLRI